MAKQSTTTAKPGLIARAKIFFQEVMTEMGKVTWPSREELKGQTTIVLLALVMMATIVGVFDKVFQAIMFRLLQLG